MGRDSQESPARPASTSWCLRLGKDDAAVWTTARSAAKRASMNARRRRCRRLRPFRFRNPRPHEKGLPWPKHAPETRRPMCSGSLPQPRHVGCSVGSPWARLRSAPDEREWPGLVAGLPGARRCVTLSGRLCLSFVGRGSLRTTPNRGRFAFRRDLSPQPAHSNCYHNSPSPVSGTAISSFLAEFVPLVQ
jgi:hypothetical protein